MDISEFKTLSSHGYVLAFRVMDGRGVSRATATDIQFPTREAAENWMDENISEAHMSMFGAEVVSALYVNENGKALKMDVQP